ncbi:hypothetical protein V5O48_000081 [Marasmius crinis-equi]|uniref:Uncharacterized protein n=1 Tax=Marasmius crinis-equi TaxID=585013 RepID=A0ABR3G2I4_9AGAR
MNHSFAVELNNSKETVASFWARTKNMGALAAAKRGKDCLPHIDTDHTARDMLAITQAHGREKSQYWGFSTRLKPGNANMGIYAKVIESPIPARTNTSYGLVDYSLWPRLPAALQALSEGNGTAFYETFGEPTFECDCDPIDYAFKPNPEALYALICGDGDPVPPELEAAQAHYEEASSLYTFGSFWASFRIACNGWSTETDPSTPLVSAKKAFRKAPRVRLAATRFSRSGA